jgi:hypothetical protein
MPATPVQIRLGTLVKSRTYKRPFRDRENKESNPYSTILKNDRSCAGKGLIGHFRLPFAHEELIDLSVLTCK